MGRDNDPDKLDDKSQQGKGYSPVSGKSETASSAMPVGCSNQFEFLYTCKIVNTAADTENADLLNILSSIVANPVDTMESREGGR